MADVQQVEAAVGQRNPAARSAIARHRFDQLLFRRESVPPVLSYASSLAIESLAIAALSSRGETVAVPRFMTTRPPA